MLQREGLFRQPQTHPLPPSERAGPTHATPVPAHAEPAAKADERKEARLTVGPDIKMKGVEVTDCDTLVVEGRIEATIDARLLQIAEHGVFQGVVAVDIAEIHGRVEGELTVRKQLVIHATGKVSGKVRYAKIKVDEGAEISGDLSVLERGAAAGGLAQPVKR